MAAKFFLKTGVKNRIPDHDGKSIQFEPRSDGRGIIALDDEKDGKLVEALSEYVRRRIGGVSEISAAEYEDLKKNHPPQPKQERSAPRVFELNADPFRSGVGVNAGPAMAPANVSLAGGASPAGSAVAQDASADPKAAIIAQGPKSKGRPAVRTNKTAPQTAPVMEPAASTPTSPAAPLMETVAPTG